MNETFWSSVPLWQRIIAYIFLLLSLYIFIKTSRLQIGGIKIIKLRYRIILALFFPIILILGLIFGAFLIGLAICVFILLLIAGFITGKKFRIRMIRLKK